LSREPWPAWAERRLTELWNGKQFSASQIASKLGTTRNAVIGKARRMDLLRKGTSNVPSRATKPPLPTRRAHPRPRPQGGLMLSNRKEATVPTGAPVCLPDLEREHCRWVLGDPKEMMFCGGLREEPHPYCEFHVKQAYNVRRP
jgi:hypothetical protein